eukprot:TRINITY_DN2519_c0_g1_i1.p2 TRINITY_DN2519_c0_g1~~TRINITY_DN2519_c0_g1_i1.p2  ORF type:complete len:752 (+),score=209.45 TRINITY_DN2519_c0_g1_i1:149-2404(+)
MADATGGENRRNSKGTASRRSSKQSRRTSNRSSNGGEGELSREEWQELQENNAATKIQALARGVSVRRAFYFLFLLEDELLQYPRPGVEIALRLLESPPPTPASGEQGLEELGLPTVETKRASLTSSWGDEDEESDGDTFPPPGASMSQRPSAMSQMRGSLKAGLSKALSRGSDAGSEAGSSRRGASKRGASKRGASKRGASKRGSSKKVSPSRRGSAATSDKTASKVESKAGSKTPSEAGSRLMSARSRGSMSARSRASSGSRAGSRRAGSQEGTEESGTPAPIVVPEESLAHRMFEIGVDPEEAAILAARAICRLLGDPQPLDSAHLERIYLHHRRRLRNAQCKVVVRLSLVVHGDTDQSHAGGKAGDPERVLTPDGFLQATRAGWALRLYEDWAPRLLMTSPERSCVQTAERLREVIADLEDDAADGDAATWDGEASSLRSASQAPSGQKAPSVAGSQRSVAASGEAEPPAPPRRRPPPPPAEMCEALAFPGELMGLGPEVYRVQDAIPPAVKLLEPEGEPEPWHPEGPHTPPLSVLLVSSGFIQETLLAVLCTKSRSLDEAGGRHGGGARLCGGDLLVAQSPPLRSITGEEFNEVRVADSVLWKRALRCPNWQVVEHLRGNGRPSERPAALKAEETQRFREQTLADIQEALAFDPFELAGEDDEMPEGLYSEGCDFATDWRKRSGEPLIFSHEEFSRLVIRAGTHYRPAEAMIAAVRPLVKNFIPREELEYDFPVEGGAIDYGSPRL